MSISHVTRIRQDILIRGHPAFVRFMRLFIALMIMYDENEHPSEVYWVVAPGANGLDPLPLDSIGSI